MVPFIKNSLLFLKELFLLKKPLFKTAKITYEARECSSFCYALIEASLNGHMRAVWLHIPNEVSNNKQFSFGSLLSHMGKIRGAPDYAIVSPHNSLFFEFKDPKRGLSKHQKLFQQWCKELAVPYYIIYDHKDALRILQLYQLLDE